MDAPSIMYRGKWRGHLLADTETELHFFASSIGINRCWFERSNKGVPHYDINLNQHIAAVEKGAILLNRKQLGNLLKKYSS